jgi:hypothetical protein
MAHWEFPGSEPIDVFIDQAAGRVTLTAQPTDVTTVELTASWPGRSERLVPDVQVSFGNGRLEIVGPRRSGLWRGHTGLDLAVTLPAGSRCMVRSASADLSCTGELAELDAHTASGDVTAAVITGHAAIQTASGDVRLEEAGAGADVRTASGDVNIGSAATSVAVVTSSGDVRLGSVAAGRADVQTVSGDIVAGVAAGVGVYLDLASATGSVTSQLEETGPSDDIALGVRCRTASGDIRIVRAAVAKPARASDAAAIEPTPAE